MNFAVGGAFCDVMHVIKNYGIVPMDVYKGLNYGEPNHAFGEIDDVLAGYINAVIKNSSQLLFPSPLCSEYSIFCPTFWAICFAI